MGLIWATSKIVLQVENLFVRASVQDFTKSTRFVKVRAFYDKLLGVSLQLNKRKIRFPGIREKPTIFH